jgi:hypothetical protein
MNKTELDEALRILGRATVEDAEHAHDVIRLSITLSTIKTLRFELSTARRTMRSALSFLDDGNVEEARKSLAHALRLDCGPIYGGEE